MNAAFFQEQQMRRQSQMAQMQQLMQFVPAQPAAPMFNFMPLSGPQGHLMVMRQLLGI